MRDITISKVMNGFVVVVGCQKLVFESRTRLVSALDLYLRDPEGEEIKFIAEYGLAGGAPGGVPAPALVPPTQPATRNWWGNKQQRELST